MENELDQLGLLIDQATDKKDISVLEQAIDKCQQLLSTEVSVEYRCLIHYFLANAWSGKRHAFYIGDDAWVWEQLELEKEILHLRLAFAFSVKENTSSIYACQILTNLGNALSHVGRSVESIEYWNRALEISAEFPMARGNRGYGLYHYARFLYDQGHQALFLKEAHKDFSSALQFELYPEAAKSFQELKSRIETLFQLDSLEEEIDLNEFSLGDSTEEISYRSWCINQALFINPLNDLGAYSIAATDVLHLPSIVVPLGEGPYYAGFFNQMKQEFVSARFLLYEGLTTDETHYSDHDVTLVNTLDYPVYSLAVEKMKFAFRVTYSLFDKIAFFLNHYLDLKIPHRKISFKTIWYEKCNREKGINSKIEALKNNALRGLFWLSKDLSERREGFVDAMEPDAQEIEQLRQHAEHRYLKIHDSFFDLDYKDDSERLGFTDTLAKSISRDDFCEKSLRMMRLSRAGLIYLCLIIQTEEERRSQERSPESPVMPMILDTWEDDWKR